MIVSKNSSGYQLEFSIDSIETPNLYRVTITRSDTALKFRPYSNTFFMTKEDLLAVSEYIEEFFYHRIESANVKGKNYGNH
jgi:hypothetical protein